MNKTTVNEKQLSRIILNGYKSIEQCDINLTKLNLLIGANGVGKSNFIGFFRLISRILDEQLQITVGMEGGPDALLHFGRKKTESITADLRFGNNGYNFSLVPTQDNRMMFQKEALWWNVRGDWSKSSGHFESKFKERKNHGAIWDFVVPTIHGWLLYHFHDTSKTAFVKQIHGINDNVYLREDARNLAAFLYRLKHHHEAHYKRIVKTIQLVAPYFGNFYLRPMVDNSEKIQLEWTEQGQDIPFTASALSDGTLRFICLATLLLQPDEFTPNTILIDEPELGLHPYAITVLGSLMRSASQKHQLIISTQSVELVNEFEVEDLIVVDKKGGASTFTRPDRESFISWLDEYSLGELWKKNILGGRPSR